MPKQSKTFDDKALAAEDIHKRLLLGNLEINEGMLMENIVAQMLTVTGRPLFFFSKYDKSNAEDRMEIDFLIAKSKIGRRKDIIPLEVKAPSATRPIPSTSLRPSTRHKAILPLSYTPRTSPSRMA